MVFVQHCCTMRDRGSVRLIALTFIVCIWPFPTIEQERVQICLRDVETWVRRGHRHVESL